MAGLLREEGFWGEGKGSKYPRPVAQTEPWFGQSGFLKLLVKLESEVRRKGQVRHYKGWSTCRICGCKNGSTEFRFKNWIWPAGFKHYIEAHNVKPSVAFMKFVSNTKWYWRCRWPKH